MDVDSSMVPEADHDPAAAAAPAPAAEEEEQLAEPPSSGGRSPATQPPVQQQQQSPPAQVQQSPVVGPRLAPTYTVVNAIIEKKEDGPGPRCGHTLTAVAAVGEEGTPGYIGPRLILFGGATALEGNSAASGTPSSAGNAGIRMYLIILLYFIFHLVPFLVILWLSILNFAWLMCFKVELNFSCAHGFFFFLVNV